MAGRGCRISVALARLLRGVASRANRGILYERDSNPAILTLEVSIMSAIALPSKKQLHELFRYCPSGRLFWKVTPGKRVQAGDMAGGTISHACGKLVGVRGPRIAGRATTLSRVIWEMHNAPLPNKVVVHHLDGDLSNNRIENLSVLTYREAGHLATMKRGPTFARVRDRLRVQMEKDFIGSFATHAEAMAAYVEASKVRYPTLYQKGLL